MSGKLSRAAQARLDRERTAFEAKMGDMNITNFERDAEGWYVNTVLEWHWRGWQAARSDTPAPLTRAQVLQIAADSDYGDEDPACLLRLADALLTAAGTPMAREAREGA
jgi:hypothetical protein